ncbi:tripartite motif-containing protein 14-like [Petromyzon marinus]|uniref:tripartite motif-containing protein 14-like n=1 Tax=Petromyzon marinus TaxID=7757 RepID=UPI003F6EA6F2
MAVAHHSSLDASCVDCLEPADLGCAQCGHSTCAACMERTYGRVANLTALPCSRCANSGANGGGSHRGSKNYNRRSGSHGGSQRDSSGDATEAAEAATRCDICMEENVAAVRTCLKCETAFCEAHIRPHIELDKFRDHPLVHPSINLRERKCKVHRKLLEVYCKRDECLVCSACTIAGKHKHHDVTTVEEEHATRKNVIITAMERVDDRKASSKTYINELKDSSDSVQQSSSTVLSKVSQKYDHMRRLLDDEERQVMGTVNDELREVMAQLQARIEVHERYLKNVSETEAHMRWLLKEEDSLTFLLACKPNTLRMESLAGVDQVDNQVRCELDPRKMESVLKRVDKRLATFESNWSYLSYGKTPTLNPNSAHPKLKLSMDLHTVTWCSQDQGYPNHPDRFDSTLQVISSESFAAGCHYWEVDVRDGCNWAVGATYSAIKRKGTDTACVLGRNRISWGLWCWSAQYLVYHDDVKTPLALSEPLHAVGVYVNFEAGVLAFYNADTMTLLYTFEEPFRKPLHPALYLAGKSLRIVQL